MAVTYWASEKDLLASDEAVSPERDRAAQTAEATSGPVVERYEVVASA